MRNQQRGIIHSLMQVAHNETRVLMFMILLIVFSPGLALGQQEGPVAVQSNGVSISFQNAGGEAKSSNGVSISFNSAGGEAKSSNGVSISFQNAGGESAGVNRGVTIGFKDPVNDSYHLGRSTNSGTFADPVNTATGNFVFDKSDLSVPGRGVSFEFKRFYNSQDSKSGPLGANWTHSYNVTVSENTTDNTATVRLDDGREEIYDKSGSTYTPKYPGIFNTLTKNSDSTFTLKKKDQHIYNFKTNGQLAAIVDRNDNIATMNYDEQQRLASVSLPGGRNVTLTYDAQSRITNVADSLTPEPRAFAYEYDSNNNLTAVIDPNGNRHEYSYDSQHQMLTAKDPRGKTFVTNTYDNVRRVVTYQTDAKGNPTRFDYMESEGRTRITDAAGNISYDYHDAFKRMVKRVDRLGKDDSYTYDGSNNRTSVSDKNGNPTLYEYDANGNVTKQTDPFGRSVTITYNSKNDPLTRTDELGNVTTFEYDSKGNLTKTTEPLGKVTTFTYNQNGQLATVTDPEGRVTTNTYDSFGNLTKVTNALGQETLYAYDGAGRRISVTDPLGQVTAFSYDLNGNLLSVTDPLGRSATYEYDGNNNRLKATNPNGRSALSEYDENNLLKKSTDALGGVVENTYNNLDRLVSVKSARGNVSSFEYDKEGRITKVTDPLGNVVRKEYDSQGNNTKSIDGRGKETNFTYDRMSRLVITTDPLGNKTSVSYDALGRVLSRSDAKGNVTSFVYDALGRLTKVTEPDGSTAEYTYDKVGNRLTVKINGNTTVYAYDALNRLKTRTNPLGKTYEFGYDAAGRLTSRKDPNGLTIGYEYYADGRTKKIAYSDGTSVAFEYDLNGNQTKMTDSLGMSTYAYDELNRLTLYTDPYGKTVGYEYDADGNRVALIYPDGRRVTYLYDASGRLGGVTDWGNRTTQYSYDPNDLLTGIANSNSTLSVYGYDDAQRLVSMVNRRSDQSIITSYAFTLDPVGNRTASTGTDAIQTSVDQSNSTYAYNQANQIQTAGGALFTSDSNGNLKEWKTNESTVTYAYDFEDRLTNLSIGSSGSQYVYNGEGLRLARTEGGVTTRFILDPTARTTRVLAETDSAGNIINYYTYGLGLIAKIRPSGQAFQYHFDSRGSTVAITDTTQVVVNRYVYDSFGGTVARLEQTFNPFRYMGQHGVTTETSGLLFATRRFYSPELGRFLTKDEATPNEASIGTFNEYIYALNNPIEMIDPTGLAGERDGASTFQAYGSTDSYNTTVLGYQPTNQSVYDRLKDAFRGALVDTRNFLGCGLSFGEAGNACRLMLDPDNPNSAAAVYGAAGISYAGKAAITIIGSKYFAAKAGTVLLVSRLKDASGFLVDFSSSKREGYGTTRSLVRATESLIVNKALGSVWGEWVGEGVLRDLAPTPFLKAASERFFGKNYISNPFTGPAFGR